MDKGEVFILNNAIDISKFKYSPEIRTQKRTELGISDDTLVIGHIGRFVQQKNHHYVIDIFNEVHKMNQKSILVLIGQGPLQVEIENKVKELGLVDSVKFLGQREDVHEWYQAFDVFLFPSIYEGLGMVAIEAQCAGCYCLASTEVPSVAKVTDNIDFVSLELPPSKWIATMVHSKYLRKRTSYDIQISEKGYDIRLETRKLEKKYEIMRSL